MMTRKAKIGRAVLCLAQASLLVLGNGGAALAASTFTTAQMTKIDGFERTLFGSPHTSLSDESRLRAIETNLFGGVKKGSLDSRLAAVEKTLKVDPGQFLQPAMPGKLDKLDVEPAPAVVSTPDVAEPKSAINDLIQDGMSKYSAGDAVGAEKLFKRALSLDSKSPDAYYNLGVVYEGRGDSQLALENYQRALALNPGDAELKDSVNSLRTKIAHEKSLQLAQQQQAAASSKKDNLRQLVSDASSDYKAGNFSEAVRKLEKVAGSAPNDPDVQYALGQAYRARGDAQNARTAFNRAMSIDPKSPLYKNALSELNNSLASATQDNRPVDNNDNTPPGQITPFSGLGSPTAMRGNDYGYEPMGGGISSFKSSRLKRTLAGSAMGAAAGALWGASSRGNLKSGMMKGALLGGMLGYFGGP